MAPPFNFNNPLGVETITSVVNAPEQTFSQYKAAQTSLPGPFSSGRIYKQKYNELFHDVELYLDNSGDFVANDNTKRYFINPSAVMNLTISDTVNDWIVDGTITIMYLPEDADPRQLKTLGTDSKTRTGAEENAETLKSYQFRTDGFDLLRVMVVPKTDYKSGVQIPENEPLWYLSYLFSIYNVEDVTGKVPGMDGNLSSYMKCVKMYFRDVRYQILKTSNIEYSTALSPNAIVDSTLANGDNGTGIGRVLYTGDAIKEVFQQAFSVALDNKGSDKLALFGTGFDWDQGAGKLFYTSPANWNADDDIQYLFSHHVSSAKKLSTGANDLCLMHTNRATTKGHLEPICITPVSDFFEKAGKDPESPGVLQLEHFFVTNLTKENAPTRNFRAPLTSDINSKRDLKTAKYGQILNYNFVDMSADINSSLFKSTPVYSVDIGKRTFNMEFKNNNVETARTAIANTYIKELYKKGSGESLFLPIIHKSKKNVNVFPTFSLNGDNEIVRQRNGILDLIYTGLFQNACICFKTFGLTLRQSGTFIGIDRADGCENTDFSNKLYGQWFVVKVDHVFEAGAYMNIIYAVKIHRHEKANAAFGEML